MTTLVLTCLVIVSLVLTLWMVIIPVGVLVGAYAALRRGGHDWNWWSRYQHPHPS